MTSACDRSEARRRGLYAAVTTVVLGLALSAAASPASAAKQVVDYFGTPAGAASGGGDFKLPDALAVNQTGAGPAEKGDVYVVDYGNNRVERFHRDDQGTPAEPYDDTYEFVSAWGADVVQSGGEGDKGNAGAADYEICVVASQCKAGIASAGNGSAAGNGSLSGPQGVAVDSDTGEVYVSDTANHRVDVYEGDDTFLRSFGYDVVGSGPDDLPGASEKQQLVVKAEGGKFSLEFEGAATGPRGWGDGEAGSTTVTDVATKSGTFEVGQQFQAFGFGGRPAVLPPGTTITAVDTGEKTLTLSAPASQTFGPTSGIDGKPDNLVVDDIPHDASAAQVESALEGLPTIGGTGGSVTVERTELSATEFEYTIEFGGALAGAAQPPIAATSTGLTLSGEEPSAEVSELVSGGAYETCVASAGDVCRSGSAGSGSGGIESGVGIAVSPAGGSVFVADKGNSRIDAYQLDGSSPAAFGLAATFATFDSTRYGVHTRAGRAPVQVAVDSRGIVYAGNQTASGAPRIERYDSEDANGGGVGFLAPIPSSVLGGAVAGLVADVDADGAGPESDVLYANLGGFGGRMVKQFGPTNPPGLSAPPAAADEVHGTGPELTAFVPTEGLAVDEADGRLYASARRAVGFPVAEGVYVLDEAGSAPEATVDSFSEVTSTSVTVHATIEPNGPPKLEYHLEYSTDGSTWVSASTVQLGVKETTQEVSEVLDPPGGGLEPNTTYHVRIAAAKKFATPFVSDEKTFKTQAAPPSVETTGSPDPTPTTVVLSGRIDPNNKASTYRFQYGTQGPCDANPCSETSAQAAGSGGEEELVARLISGLATGTTYHYRLLADNGTGGPVYGQDMTVVPRPALANHEFPSPPGNDRAYEQVSAADSGGNPVLVAFGFAKSGNRALYQISGGAPISESGTFFSQLLAEREETAPHVGGWRSRTLVTRAVSEAGSFPDWTFKPNPSLSEFIGYNDSGVGSLGEGLDYLLWRLAPGGPFTQLLKLDASRATSFYEASEDTSRAVTVAKGSFDPEHPVGESQYHLYDVSGPAPHLLDLLPDGSVPTCGVEVGTFFLQPYQMNTDGSARNWVSPDGSSAIFASTGDECNSPSQLYLRQIEAGQTKPISGPPLSGPSCTASFLRATEDAAFIYTKSRLSAADTAPSSCGPGGGEGADVYRYDLGEGSFECVTCVVPGLGADVQGGTGSSDLTDIGVSEDGSTVYFVSPNRLVAGAAVPGIYRVKVASGDLAYVGPGADTSVGAALSAGSAVSADGSVLVFRSKDPGLNPLGDGTENGGTSQYYRYDDRDRSLVCVSCPPDGSPPRAGVRRLAESLTYNGDALSEDGSVLAFDSPSPLVNADQNTTKAGENPHAGDDVYEWRDGRALLITDGLTNWPSKAPDSGGFPDLVAPQQFGVSPSGRDVFFTAAARYTPDAPDTYTRLYDARLGGGFEFAKPAPPCPLEVCQGTPRGAPEEQEPSSANFRGLGNKSAPSASRCPKGKRKVRRKGKARCIRQPRKHAGKQKRRRANHERRASR